MTKPPTTPLPRRFYTVAEAAEVLRMSKATVYRRVQDGELRAVRIGHRVVIPVAVLDALVKAAS